MNLIAQLQPDGSFDLYDLDKEQAGISPDGSAISTIPSIGKFSLDMAQRQLAMSKDQLQAAQDGCDSAQAILDAIQNAGTADIKSQIISMSASKVEEPVKPEEVKSEGEIKA